MGSRSNPPYRDRLTRQWLRREKGPRPRHQRPPRVQVIRRRKGARGKGKAT